MKRAPHALPGAITVAEWRAEGVRLFGEDMFAWRFVCPCCGHVAKVADWRDAGAPEGAVAFSCVGRWTGGGTGAGFFVAREGDPQKAPTVPCNYAGGGLFGLNPVEVIDPDGIHRHVFAFADKVATAGKGA